MSALFRLATVVSLLALFPDAAASAQTPWEDRAFININLGFRPTTVSFDEFSTPVFYDERGTVRATHRIDGGITLIDVGGGVRVWRGLGVGGTLSRVSPADTTAVDASVPHPGLFNRPRRASAEVVSKQVQTTYHIDALWLIPLRSRLDVALSGGPSLIFLSQDLVSGIAVAEDSPTFATVAIAKVNVVAADERVLGMHVGADVTYFLQPMIGVGATIRFVRATADFTHSDGTRVSVDAGGLQFAVGARLRFR